MLAAIFMPRQKAAAETGHDVDVQPVPFDVPAQPLELALLQFMDASKTSVIADSSLTATRKSSELKGRFSAEQGLRRLLSGTGLYPRAIGDRAFTLEAPLPDGAMQPLPRFASYSAAIQQAVIEALCRREETQPTHYRVVLRLWLDPAGTVGRVEVDGSTGSRDLDKAIARALRDVAIAEAVPSSLPQPVKLAILPRQGGEGGPCSSQRSSPPLTSGADR